MNQGFGALGHQVVDAHGNQFGSDGLVPAGGNGEFELGADAVGTGHQDWVPAACGTEVEQGTDATQARFRAGAPGRFGKRPDRFDQGRAGVDVPAGLFIAGAGNAFSLRRNVVSYGAPERAVGGRRY